MKGNAMGKFVFVVALMLAVPAFAQPTCICTAGCRIASAPLPSGTPTDAQCSLFRDAGIWIAVATVRPASDVNPSDAGLCLPASPPYDAGTPGSLACIVTIPAASAPPPGKVSVYMTLLDKNGQNETAGGTPFVFINAATLPTLKPPGGLRHTK